MSISHRIPSAAGDVFHDQWMRIAVFLLVMAVAIIPVWSVELPPLLDYPNHLARQYILANLGADSILQQFYQAQWGMLPNLAMDAVVQTLAGFMPVETAGKVFLSITLLLVILPPLLLSKVIFGEVKSPALLALLFAYSQPVTLGFLNFVFSVGLAIAMFALWVRYRQSHGWLLAILFPFFAIILLFSHLSGLGVYLICVGGYELGELVRQFRKGGYRGLKAYVYDYRTTYLAFFLQVLIPATLFLAFSPESSKVAESIYGGIDRKIHLLTNFFSYLIQPHFWSFDHYLALLLAAAIAVGLLLRILFIPASMWWPLLMLLLAFVVLPMSLMGGWGVDHRLLLPLGLVLSGVLGVKRGSTAMWRGITLLLMTLVIIRVAMVSLSWKDMNRKYQEYYEAFEYLAAGSRVYYAFGHQGGKVLWPAPVYHVPCLAVMKKSLYLPFLFANPTQQPLRYTAEYEKLRFENKGPLFTHGSSPNWLSVTGKYDYLLLVDEQYFKEPVPGHLKRLYKGKHVAVYATR